MRIINVRSRKIHQVMRKIVSEHVDPLTGEVNCTTLAEEAADIMGENPEDGSDIDEVFFEEALFIAGERERQYKGRPQCSPR